MDSVALWLYLFESDEDDEVEDDVVEERIGSRQLRDESNIMELSDKCFVENFRLSKDAFVYLLKGINNDLKVTCRQNAVPNVIKLSATLNFLASGGFQRQVGREWHAGLAQPTMSNIIAEVCNAIEKVMCPKHINFVMTEEEKNVIKKHFFEKSGIPGVIGVIDGMQIPIMRPRNHEHLFYNENSKFSLNAMMICDHTMRIRCINGRFGGASDDSEVWSCGNERQFLKSSFEKGDKSSWILGDTDYPLEPWLLTPYENAFENSAEAKFNEKSSLARSVIGSAFVFLRGRFQCLLPPKELHYTPEKAVQILNVCCALHNICLKYNVEMPDEIPVNAEEAARFDDFGDEPYCENSEFLFIAEAIRDKIRDSLQI